MSADASPRISVPPTGDEFVATAHCDVVEWPRLSQAIRLEREAATHSYSVYDYGGIERGVFYSFDAVVRFCDKYGFHSVNRKPILTQKGGSR